MIFTEGGVTVCHWPTAPFGAPPPFAGAIHKRPVRHLSANADAVLPGARRPAPSTRRGVQLTMYCPTAPARTTTCGLFDPASTRPPADTLAHRRTYPPMTFGLNFTGLIDPFRIMNAA